MKSINTKYTRKTSAWHLLLLGAVVLLQACSYTATRNTSPYFDGQIKLASEPLANAKVLLSRDASDTQCIKAVQNTLTDAEGRFSLKPVQEQHKYKPFVNFKLDEWVLCVESGEQRYTLYSNNRYDMGSVVGSLYLKCDLAHKGKSGYCKVSP